MNERLKNSIEVLQRAYLEETLQAGDCEACAVGNLVAASNYKGVSYNWRFVFCTEMGLQRFYDSDDDFTCEKTYNEGMKAIEATGYSVEELALIEYTFETAILRHLEMKLPKHVSQWMRLEKVIKVLFEIEGIPYNQEVEEPFLEKALS
jgi:hypothetical protein